MYAAGQRKISLLMHLLASPAECLDLSSPPPDVCHTTHRYGGGDAGWGYAVPLDSSGKWRPQHLRNLKNLLADIRRTGFRQVNIRFGTFGALDPRGWAEGSPTSWDAYHESLFNIYWTALRSAIDSVNRWVPPGDSLVVLYDLNFEIATYILQLDGRQWNADHSFGHVAEHTRRIWRNYVARYGNTRTIGFTFGNRIVNSKAQGWRREVITVMDRLVYDSVGQRPSGYAFDIYQNAPGDFSGLGKCKYPCYDRFFEEVARQARIDSIPKQILIWEASYNDAKFADAVKKANQKLKLGIPYIMQWPAGEQPWGAQFTVNVPRDFDRYLRLSR
jgi:hypothetical protein